DPPPPPPPPPRAQPGAALSASARTIAPKPPTCRCIRIPKKMQHFRCATMCIKIWHERVDVAEAEEKPTGRANFAIGTLAAHENCAPFAVPLPHALSFGKVLPSWSARKANQARETMNDQQGVNARCRSGPRGLRRDRGSASRSWRQWRAELPHNARIEK